VSPPTHIDTDPHPLLQSLGNEAVGRALLTTGVYLDVGLATLCVRGRSRWLAPQLREAYRHFPLRTGDAWADVDLRLDPPRGVRRWYRPQVQLIADGTLPFEPFPADHPLPMLEWGANLLIGQRCAQVLLFHAGVLERDGLALLLPAVPGSGKSTLSAALSLAGWRLLSDEFGAYDPHSGRFHAVLKPVALKNRSIDVIRDRVPEAPLGPTFAKTRKGDVAHLAASREAVRRVHEPAVPGAVVLPRWQAGSGLRLTRLTEDSVFRSLAFNSFNYQTLGEAGFDAAVGLARRCPGLELVYSRLDDALVALDDLWSEIRSGASREPGTDAELLRRPTDRIT
jgi:HprK-related kinase A